MKKRNSNNEKSVNTKKNHDVEKKGRTRIRKNIIMMRNEEEETIIGSHEHVKYQTRSLND